MSTATIRRLTVRLADIQAQIQAIGPVMRGSVTRMGERNKQPYFSVSLAGKTRVIYLGDERAHAAAACVANYRQLMTLIDESTRLHMQLLKLQGTRKS